MNESVTSKNADMYHKGVQENLLATLLLTSNHLIQANNFMKQAKGWANRTGIYSLDDEKVEEVECYIRLMSEELDKMQSEITEWRRRLAR